MPKNSNFNPHPREGGDSAGSMRSRHRVVFQSTPPARGGRPFGGHNVTVAVGFQSTPPARGATRQHYRCVFREVISIHAPREGGDSTGVIGGDTPLISIHAPREGGDYPSAAYPFPDRYFNPRPPRGGRRSPSPRTLYLIPISIHAPREGGDGAFLFFPLPPQAFQSTPPARGATAAMTIDVLAS